MPTLEERVAYLEGKVEEHSRGLDGVREAVVHLEQRIDGRFEAVDRRFEAIDRRLDALDHKLDQRTAALDQKLDQRTRELEEQMSRQFVWLVSAHVTTLVTIVAVVVAALLAR